MLRDTFARGLDLRVWMAICALAISVMIACSPSPAFMGSALEPLEAAPPFQLQDQFGNQIKLADLKSEVVVLTFLYTSCPDVCPITTSKLHSTHELLGDAAKRVRFVAISVDPERDTVERVYRYSEERDMLDKWSFLVGNREQLEQAWESYFIAVESGSSVRSLREGVAVSDSSGDSGGHEGADEDYLVGHSAPVFLIDRDGRLRVVFPTEEWTPAMLVHDIRIMLR